MILVNDYIRGYQNITCFPRGIIQYLNNYKDEFEMANLFFESNYNLVVKHLFNNDEYNDYKIKIERSNGDISDAWFKK